MLDLVSAPASFWLLFLSAVLAINISPGPDMLFIRAISQLAFDLMKFAGGGLSRVTRPACPARACLRRASDANGRS